MKRKRWKYEDHTLIGASEKHEVNIIKALGLERANGVSTPQLGDDRPEHSSPVELERAKVYRSVVMTLLYMATDRPDMQYEINDLTSFLAAPTEYDWRCFMRGGRYLVSHRRRATVLRLHRSEPNHIKLGTEVDTDWAGDKITRRSRCCFHIRADGAILASSVRRQSFLAMSSGEAEFGGIHTGAIESYPFKLLFERLGFRVTWEVKTDSAAAKGACHRLGTGKTRHMDLRLLWSQHAVKKLGLIITKIDWGSRIALTWARKSTRGQTTRSCAACQTLWPSTTM